MPALPSGTILMWHGSVATIPSGYVLCDGTHGTPDLRDRFIIGAGGAHDPGDTGGSTSHSHDFTGDGHSHTLIGGDRIQAGTGHDNTSTTNPATGTSDPTNHLPTYRALVYIMKT